MKSLIEALELVQVAIRQRFGTANGELGQQTVYISPDQIDITDEEGTIVAEGAPAVARYLERK